MSDYLKVSFKITPFSQDAADLLAAFLADIGFDSFEEASDSLDAFITSQLFSQEALRDTLADFPIDVEISWQSELIRHKDWNEEWEKNYFKPLVLADGRCVVHSSFHIDYPPSEFEIIIDPKMAFGTGHHATTSMMVNHLFDINLEGKSLLDMGTGTGILAILASKLKAHSAVGIEIDKGAYENAIENAALNQADIFLLHGDASLLKDIKDIDVFLANINRNIILADLDRYVQTLKPGGILILSGFYKSDIPLLEAALIQNGMKIASTSSSEDNWASIKSIKI